MDLEERYNIDEQAAITDNMDEATATLTNSDGMSLRISNLFCKHQFKFPAASDDFIAQGWATAKSNGAKALTDGATPHQVRRHGDRGRAGRGTDA